MMKKEYLKCEKCGKIIFQVKKIRDTKDGGMFAKLICSKCKTRLVFPKGITQVVIQKYDKKKI